MKDRFYVDIFTSEVLDRNRPGWFSMFEDPAFASNTAWSLNQGITQPEDWFWALKAGYREEEAS